MHATPSPTAILTPARERSLLLALAGVQFTHILDFMIMMPLGPQLTALFGISDAQFGGLVSAYTLAAGASGLAAMAFIDRLGRKRLLLVLYGLFALATLACGLAQTHDQLLAARIAAGAFGGVLSALVQTIAADVVPFERRGRATATLMSAFSLSTVAGVPLGLWLAATWDWHMPFFFIAGLSVLIWGLAAASMPPLREHLAAQREATPWAEVGGVLADRNHLKALGFTVLLMFGGFVVIPYITIAIQANHGVSAAQVPLVYLIGGLATLVSAPIIGRLTDRLGKQRTFAGLALLTCVPTVALTWSGTGWPLGAVLVVTTALFVLLSGRMIPGMALVASAAHPSMRGSFMSLNGAVQSGAMAAAAYLGGQLIGRDPSGHVTHYGVSGLVACGAAVLAVAMVRALRLHGDPKATPEA
jgi:predicted MFS family arabinose efflux permease